MEQIETQVSDLRYLAQQTPAALGGPAGAATYGTPQPQLGSPGSASAGENSAFHRSSALGVAPTTPGGTRKRRLTDDGSAADAGLGPGSDGGLHGQKQTRSKRNRYISIACNECKRRKIKCNGQTPCQRCGHLNLACLYASNCCTTNFKDSDDFKQVTAQLRSLRDDVSRLNQTVAALQQGLASSGPLPDFAPVRSVPSAAAQSPLPPMQRSETVQPRRGSFRGPTSMAYSLDVANKTISEMGFSHIDDNDTPLLMEPRRPTVHGPGDPLLEFDKDEMIRLCQLHEEEVGIMYPVVDIQSVISHVRDLSAYLDQMRSQRSVEPVNDGKSLQLKMILCCALVVEEHGHSEKAIRVYDSMEAILNRKLMADASNVADLPLLALLAGYRFLSGQDVLSWRVMGQVARLCLELGLHQRDNLLKIQDERQRRDALMSFWTAYVLDRRWAFATGLPYIMQDDDIDRQLPYPDGHPFLLAMIKYARLAARVWRQVYHFGPVLARDLCAEEMALLDDEILKWYDSVPVEVKVFDWRKGGRITSTPSYNLQRLRIWTYLRLNQMRIWLYTPILQSATSIMTFAMQAQIVVDLAKDTIRYLDQLNNTTNLYRRNQTFYHQFLSSAIAVLFLASVHAPVRFSAACREEFYLALELVKDLSPKSWASQRLWNTIKSLKDVAPRFGLNPDDEEHSNAATGMIGLVRGDATPVSSAPGPAQRKQQQQQQHRALSDHSTQVPPQDEETDRNGAMIQSELSRMFEGYVGLNGFQADEHPHGSQTEMATPSSAVGITWGPDGTVFPYFRDMF